MSSLLDQSGRNRIEQSGVINLDLAIVLKQLGVPQKSLSAYTWWSDSNALHFHRRSKDADTFIGNTF